VVSVLVLLTLTQFSDSHSSGEATMQQALSAIWGAFFPAMAWPSADNFQAAGDIDKGWSSLIQAVDDVRQIVGPHQSQGHLLPEEVGCCSE